jgi:hypothetical protein
MGIQHIEESKILKKQFDRLGRQGISERAIELINEYMKEFPNHHYKEVTKLVGKFHALFVAIDNGDYWKEIAQRGYRSEYWDLQKHEAPEEPTPNDK